LLGIITDGSFKITSSDAQGLILRKFYQWLAWAGFSSLGYIRKKEKDDRPSTDIYEIDDSANGDPYRVDMTPAGETPAQTPAGPPGYTGVTGDYFNIRPTSRPTHDEDRSEPRIQIFGPADTTPPLQNSGTRNVPGTYMSWVTGQRRPIQPPYDEDRSEPRIESFGPADTTPLLQNSGTPNDSLQPSGTTTPLHQNSGTGNLPLEHLDTTTAPVQKLDTRNAFLQHSDKTTPLHQNSGTGNVRLQHLDTTTAPIQNPDTGNAPPRRQN